MANQQTSSSWDRFLTKRVKRRKFGDQVKVGGLTKSTHLNGLTGKVIVHQGSNQFMRDHGKYCVQIQGDSIGLLPAATHRRTSPLYCASKPATRTSVTFPQGCGCGCVLLRC